MTGGTTSRTGTKHRLYVGLRGGNCVGTQVAHSVAFSSIVRGRTLVGVCGRGGGGEAVAQAEQRGQTATVASRRERAHQRFSAFNGSQELV